MQAEQRSTEPAGLEALRNQIEAWRGMRPRTRSMPPALWSEAAAMARERGVYRVARALRLNFDTLKRQAGSASMPGRRRRRSVTGTVLEGAPGRRLGHTFAQTMRVALHRQVQPRIQRKNALNPMIAVTQPAHLHLTENAHQFPPAHTRMAAHLSIFPNHLSALALRHRYAIEITLI